MSLDQMLFDGAPTRLAASDAAWGYTVVVLAGFFIVGSWCLAFAVRRRELLPLLMLISGLFTVGIEPVIDNLGRVWYAADNPLVVYTAMGVPQPAFLLFGYSLFFGGTAYIGSRFVMNGTSVWKIFAAVFTMDLIVEWLGVPIFHVGSYYGLSPFRLFDFPLWWAFVNAASCVVGVGLLHALEPRLHGWHRLGVLMISPASFGGTHGACAWPVWVTMHSSAAVWAVWLGGSVTIALALLTVHGVRLLISPVRETMGRTGDDTGIAVGHDVHGLNVDGQAN